MGAAWCPSYRACRYDRIEEPSRIVEGLINMQRCVCASSSIIVKGSSDAVEKTWIKIKYDKDEF